MTNEARVTGLPVEVLSTGAPDAVVTEVSVEVVNRGAPDARVSELAVEAFNRGAPDARVSDVVVEPFHRGAPIAEVTAVHVDVWRSIRDTPWPIFPVRLFSPPTLKAALPGGAEGGGQAVAGDEAMAALASGGRWVVEFGEAPLWTAAKVRTWREFVAAADFGNMPVIVPIWDRRHQPFAKAKLTTPTDFGREVWGEVWTWSEDQCHAELTADVALGATSLSFTYAGAARPTAGEHFSILGGRWGWRLYRLIRIDSDEDGVVTAEVRPPLREFARAVTPLNFDSPRLSARCDGDIDALVDRLRFGRGTARFVETWQRYP